MASQPAIVDALDVGFFLVESLLRSFISRIPIRGVFVVCRYHERSETISRDRSRQNLNS